jgi:hypothetical protein
MTTRHGRARAALMAALTVLALAGCVAIPRSGPVQAGRSEVVEPAGVVALAEGPRPGAKPVELVESFLINAPLDFRDQFAVGRLYLAGEAIDTWKPLAGVVVAGQPDTVAVGSATVQVDVPVVARVDADGRYSEAAPGAHDTLTYELVQDDEGQWRISKVPSGLVVSELDFESLYRATSLYFLSPDSQYLVPEVRWLPTQNLATSAVRALLAGPSPWLRDAVRTAVPEGVQLKPQAVPVVQGVATVVLDAARTSAVLDADRPLLLAQIEATLRQVPEVSKVELQVGGVPLDDDGGAATLQRGSAPGGDVELLQAGRLMRLSGNDLVPVPDVEPLAGLDPHSPARNDDGSVRVMLSGRGALVTVPTAGAPADTLVTGPGLAAPSVDRFGWAWTGDASGELLAGKAGASPVRMTPDWAQGRVVSALRVSRDGARVAVVSHGADGVAVDVVAVTRDDETGVPQQVGTAVRVGVPLVDASAVVWLDESTLGVLGTMGGTTALQQVPVAGATKALPEVGDLVGVAGGKQPYVSTADGELLRLVGQSWVRVPDVEGVTDPSYPG